MGPVLFPTDDSPCAERARPWAERLAAALGAPLHVLRVEVVGAADLRPDDFVTISRADLADDLRLPQRPAPDGPVEVARRSPDPARTIVGYAAEAGASLVVMGTHGRGGFDRLVLGSVAELVMRRAAGPVLVVPCAGEPADPPNLAHVAVADDLTPVAEHALAEAARLARATGAAPAVVHVVEEMHAQSPYGPLSAPPPDYEALVPRVEAALRARAAAAGLPDAPVAVRCGDAVEEVLAFARERGAGLVVVGSHGRTGVLRALLGSVAEGLVRRAALPVLIVRPERGEDG